MTSSIVPLLGKKSIKFDKNNQLDNNLCIDAQKI